MNLEQLELKANEIRQDIIRMLVSAKSGHVAGPLDMADVFTALYFGVMNYDPKNPQMESRDRFVLSCGHINPVWYATMAHAGFFPTSELATLRKLGTRLHGHPHNEALPGIENSSGPLGQGLSQAAAMAYAGLILKKQPWRVYCVMSDGEQEEGQTWEAAMFASKYKLRNLTGLIDACNQAKAIYEKPTVIICHTIPGKGVDFMEYRYEWHSKVFEKDEAKKALDELRTLGGKIRSEHE